jgi:hypothetical protein
VFYTLDEKETKLVREAWIIRIKRPQDFMTLEAFVKKNNLKLIRNLTEQYVEGQNEFNWEAEVEINGKRFTVDGSQFPEDPKDKRQTIGIAYIHGR